MLPPPPDDLAATVTVTLADMLPPGPVQVIEKLRVADSAPLSAEPEVAVLEVHPSALQLPAPVEDQVSFTEPPEPTFVASAASVTVGVDAPTA
jgi:hypothetical protein